MMKPVPLPVPGNLANGLGLAFVHQNLGLIPSLSLTENLRLIRELYPNATPEPAINPPETALVRIEDRDEARAKLLRGWTEAAGPVSVVMNPIFNGSSAAAVTASTKGSTAAAAVYLFNLISNTPGIKAGKIRGAFAPRNLLCDTKLSQFISALTGIWGGVP